MESDDKSPPPSLGANPFVDLKRIAAENERHYDTANSLINNSTIQAIVDKFNMDDFSKNHPLADEIEHGVKELIKENNQLKDTLQFTTTSMKRHFMVLQKWIENEHNGHMDFKRKSEEAKDVIEKLKLENSDLKRPTQDMIRSLDVKLESEKNKLLHENQALRNKFTALQQKFSKFQQRTVSHNSEKEQELYQAITSLSRQLENSERTRKKLTLDVERLNGQEMKLQQLLAKGDSRNVTNSCYWSAMFPSVNPSLPRENQLIENLTEYIKLLQSEGDTFNNLSRIIDSSQKSCVDENTNEEEKSVEQLKEEISVLRKQISLQQTTCILCKKLFNEVRSKFKMIYEQTLAILKEHDAKLRAHEISLEKVKEDCKDVSSLRHEISDKQNRILQLESDLNLFKKKLIEAEKKQEDYYVLQSQIKVYEEDYISEREARESLANEKLKLEHTLHLLTQENAKLIKKLHISADGDLNNLTRESEPTVNTTRYVCFNETCKKLFDSEEELQTHVYSCFNLKD